MAIDNVPAVQDVIEQTGLLERLFHMALDAKLAYSRVADEEIFPNGIGETLTKTRPALYPLSQAFTPINPSNNSGLDNGLTDAFYTFEQYQIAISEWALSTTTNIMQDRTLIQRVFKQNYVQLGENAGRTIDATCAQYVHKAYDAGSTFALGTCANGGTSITVDNIYGFDYAFSATNSPGLPLPVSVSNPITVNVYDKTTGAFKTSVVCTGAAAASPNASTSFVGGIAYGASGTLTLTAGGWSSGSATIAATDLLVSADGPYIVRPNSRTSRATLVAGDILTLKTIANAVARLRARNVPTLPSGNYACIIDPTLWPQLLSDTAFNYATMGQMGEGYFAKGLVNRTLGVEFIDSNMVPVFNTYASGAVTSAVTARHAVVCGMGLLQKATFQGHIEASSEARQMDNSDIKFIDRDKIALITRGPLDRLQEFVTQSWRWVGGFVAPTDYSSTPLIIPTTDYARYKRAVVIECADK